MHTNKSNQTFDIENEAKNTLAFFSDYDCEYNYNDWDIENRLNSGSKRRQFRLLDPIKNNKLDKLEKNKVSNGHCLYRGRTALVPYKVSL
jgi:hypothetical protein